MNRPPTDQRLPWRVLHAIRNARRSLAGKLMVVMLVTTLIALTAAGAALIITDLRDSRANWADDMRTEAGIVAFAVQPALSFNDHDRAERNLSSLQARESISAAALYTPDGALFAQYVRQGHAPPPARPPGDLEFDMPRIDGERVLLLRPVIQNGETLGSIYLRAEYDIGERVRAYLNILGAVMIIGLLAALFASSWLHRVVSRPMDSMAQVARRIVEERDYSYRADKITDDEIGVVIDAFNKMLDEVQSHARALENSEKLYRAIGESINYGVWVTDAGGRCIYASDSFLKLIGFTMQQAANDGWARMLDHFARNGVAPKPYRPRFGQF
jgi:PAS domain-containing protein